MHRRALLIQAGAAMLASSCAPLPPAVDKSPPGAFRRVRPSDPAWPDVASWERLNRAVGGQLIKVRSPITECFESLQSPACTTFVKHARNPYYLGDEVGLTQNLGWVDAWTSRPSVYAVAARTTADVIAGVNFAREHQLRLVVKGGGHSYLGTSCAPDSLLIWTRRMNAITVHDAFTATGCEGRDAPQPAVTVGAGAIWMPVYDAVTVKRGRYVQGGGCTTVGVAGLIQSGGFGSFSKRYGLAAGALLEAEVVTADGTARIANACTNPDLFWGIRGGGGGSLGVVTRVTLRTRELPEFFGGVFVEIVFRRDNTIAIRLVFQDLTQQQAEAVWRPLLGAVASEPRKFTVTSDRPGAPADNVAWAGDAGQASQFIHGYQSLWLSADLLRPGARDRFGDAVFAATRHWGFSLHFNKGLAGAPASDVEAARNTATNPAVLSAFALAIAGAEGPPAYPGVTGHEPDVAAARRNSGAIGRAMNELRKLAGAGGSYVSESNFFEKDWQRSYWGENYPRLLAIKNAYDPDGLFFVHHGVGSEHWSADGFTR